MNRTVLVLFFITYALALYHDDSPVFKLTEKNFKSSVLESDEFWFVEFYGKVFK